MRPLALAAVLLCGCTFNRAGVGGHAADLLRGEPLAVVDASPVDQPRSERLADGAADREKSDRVIAADKRPGDKSPWPDKGLPMPISTAALGNAFITTKVACVKSDGSVISGQQIPLADGAGVSFNNGSITLGGAAAATKTWAGSQPSVIVVFDPNACDSWEDPSMPSGSDWSTGGLLIRKATLQSGQLLLQAGVTIQDLNAMNVNSDGTFQEDFFEPDDSKLSDFPQLVQPITRAKQMILSLGNL